MAKKRQGPAKGALNKQQKVSATLSPSDCALARLSYVLELGSASTWEYLSAEEVSSLLQVCTGTFSQGFADTAALKAIDNFAVENKTHLGRQCGCDWLRSLEFVCRSNDECDDAVPFSVDKTLPIFEMTGGAQAFLDALIMTKTLMHPFASADKFNDATFVPIVCPLASKEAPILQTKAAITRAMNDVSPKAGARYFYKFKLRSGSRIDYLEHHWGGIDGSTCQYCDQLSLDKWCSRQTKLLRANCEKLYRPLKATMEQNLQHVKFIRRRHWSRQQRLHVLSKEYAGLAAGITKGGVLCGLYLTGGYWPR
ncbi:hypothetical protein ON010_g15512 [Phytophthora cinnamomi]|nr:hypothetical protein ON010_g15512 [Phytophthora cinnamomi]